MKTKPSDIVLNRAKLLAQRHPPKPVSVNVGFGNLTPQQPSVNTFTPEVFTIVSWNIQDFHESKVYSNPFVNTVIQQVLKALKADLTVIVESQLAPAAIYSGIEHGISNPVDFDWDKEVDDGETVDDYHKRVEVDGKNTMSYYAVGSDLTFKRHALPDSFKASEFGKFFTTVDKGDAPTDLPWKNYYKDTLLPSKLVPEPLKKFYSIHLGNSKELDANQVKALKASDHSNIEFRMRKGVTPTELEHTTLSQMLVDMGVFKADKESYAILFAWQTDPNKEIPRLPLQPVCAQGKWAEVNGPGCRLVHLNTSGKDAGFQTPDQVTRNFRVPYLVPLKLQLMDGSTYEVPLLAFHAPWDGGVKARTASVESILAVNIAPIGSTAMAVADAPSCIVLGDFNLDYKTGSSGAAKTFLAYTNKGFQELNQGGKTSVKPLFKKKTKTLDAQDNYNYDHILVKGAALQKAVLQAGVIDVQGHIADYVDHCLKTGTTLPLNMSDNDDVVASKYASKDLGAYIYRKYVSDHLPVYVDLIVTQNPLTLPSTQPNLPNLPPPVPSFGAWDVSDVEDFDVLPGIALTQGKHVKDNEYTVVALIVAVYTAGFYAVTLNDVTPRTLYFELDVDPADFPGIRKGRYLQTRCTLDAKARRGIRKDLMAPHAVYTVVKATAYANLALQQLTTTLDVGKNPNGSFRVLGLVRHRVQKQGKAHVVTGGRHLVEVSFSPQDTQAFPQWSWVVFDAKLEMVGLTLGLDSLTVAPSKPSTTN